MPTAREVRTAIIWADKYLKRLINTFSWGGKNYAVFKPCPSTPITIKTSKPVCDLFGDTFPAGDVRIPDGILWGWYECADLETTTQTGEVWSGTYTFKFWKYDPDLLGYVDFIFARVLAMYYPDPKNPKQMYLGLTQGLWNDHGFDFTGDLYLGSELVIKDLRANVGKSVAFRTDDFGCFPANKYNLREDQFSGAYYLWNHLCERDLARRMFSLLDDYEYKIHTSGPLWLVNENYPDNFLCNCDELAKDCWVWADLPRGTYFYPHLAKRCISPYLVWCTPMCFGDPDMLGALSVRALHLLTKYQSTHVRDELGNTPLDYLLYGWTDVSLREHPSLAEIFVTGKGSTNPKAPEYYLGPIGFVPMTVLGYGFGYTQAREIADDMADVIIKTQWGYPFKAGEEGKGYYEGYGLINRPDHTGGMMQVWKWITVDAELKPEASYVRAGWLAQLTSLLHYGMPPEWAIIQPTWLIPTLGKVIGLRIYEYYKWRRETADSWWRHDPAGPLYPVWLPLFDIKLSGRVDMFDALRLTRNWGPGGADTCPPCDINGDGTVNIIDAMTLMGVWGFKDDPEPRKITATVPTLRSEYSALITTLSYVSTWSMLEILRRTIKAWKS